MTGKSHILVFSLAYRPYIGGAEIALEEIMKRLPQYSFTVITARTLKNFNVMILPEMEEQGNVRIVRVGLSFRWMSQYFYPFFAVRRAWHESKSQKLDAVWGMMESYGGIAAMLFHKKCSTIPYLLTMQSGDSDRFWAWRTWFWKSWYKKVYTRAARIQAISTYLASRALHMGAQKDKIEVIPNGVDLAQFSTPISPEDRQQLRRLWGIGDEGMAIITASRLVEKNGIDILIGAYGMWRREHAGREARLIIAGKGPCGNRLKQLAARHNISREIIFIGEVPYNDLPRYLQASDIFARPSRSEGLGNAFLEAMAAGTPLIGTSVGGIPDFLEDGETGLMVSLDDVKGLADAIERLMNDSALRARLKENGKQKVKEEYLWDHIAGRMEGLLQSVMKGGSKGCT